MPQGTSLGDVYFETDPWGYSLTGCTNTYGYKMGVTGGIYQTMSLGTNGKYRYNLPSPKFGTVGTYTVWLKITDNTFTTVAVIQNPYTQIVTANPCNSNTPTAPTII